MEQNENEGRNNAEFIGSLVKKNVNQEKIKLAKEDLEYGLSEDQIKLYLDDEYTPRQARLMSDCMREESDAGLMIVIQHQGFHRMDQAIRFYKKGISLTDISEALEKTGTASELNTLLTKKLKEEEKIREDSIRRLEEFAAERRAKKAQEIEAKAEKAKAEAKLKETEASEQTGAQETLSQKEEGRNDAELEADGKPAAEQVRLSEGRRIKEGCDYMYSEGTVFGGFIPIEVAPKRESDSVSYLGSLFGRRNPGAAIIKKLVKNKFTVEQLEQIRIGVSKGLDAKILDKICNPKLEPEIMASLIGVALDAEKWNG